MSARGEVDASGSMASALINASAATTSAHVCPDTSRTALSPCLSSIVSWPLLTRGSRVIETLNVRARSPGVAGLDLAVRART